MILAFVGAVLLAGASAASLALGYRRAAEWVVATWCLATCIVVAMMHASCIAGALSRGSAISIVLAASAGCLAFAWSRRREIAWPPLRARGVAARAGVAVVAIVTIHAVVATWLLPSESWDGIWYHDTIVGWVLQTGSSAPMPLPPNLLQQVNGFPRNAELTSAWIALLDGRAFLELPNTLASLPLVCGAYLLTARFCERRSTAVALACVGVLVPGAVLQLRSTYVDVFAAAACVASLHFSTKAPLALRDVTLAGVALAIYVGTKSSSVLVAPFIVALLAVRSARLGGIGGGRRALTLTGTALLLTASVAVVYGKNAVVYDNPLYPLDLAVPRLGLHWRGVRAATDLDVNASVVDTFASVFLPSSPGRDFADIRSGGYGLAFAWIGAPLALVGLARAVRTARSASSAGMRARALLCLGGVVAPSVVLSPALWSARYHLHSVIVALAFAGYALDLAWIRRAREPVLCAAVALSTLALVRFEPALGDASLSRMWASLKSTPSERASATRAEWTIAPEVAAARERELGRGATVVFGPGVTFPSVLYNERYSNRLVYVEDATAAALRKRIQEIEPTWIVARRDEPLYAFATARPHQWQRIGLASRGQPTIAFRSVQTQERSTQRPADKPAVVP